MNQEFNGNVKVNGNDVALKGSTLVASGTLRISNTSEGVAFKIIDGQGSPVAAYGVYLFKTNLG